MDRIFQSFTADLILNTSDEEINIDERLKNLIENWRCQLKMTDCSISNDPKHIMELIRAIDPVFTDAGDIANTLKSIPCSSDHDVSKSMLQLIFAENMAKFIPNIIETCSRCKLSRRIALEYLYEDLPHILRVTSVESWLPLFERITSDVEYKMVICNQCINTYMCFEELK